MRTTRLWRFALDALWALDNLLHILDLDWFWLCQTCGRLELKHGNVTEGPTS